MRLQKPRQALLFVRCRDTGRRYLVDGGSAVTLWPQSQPSRGSRPANLTLTSASGNEIPTFGTTTREINLGGRLFTHQFVCARVKQPILGRDFLADNRLVENYAGRFLTQIQTDLFIPADNQTRPTDSVNHVQVDRKVKQLLRDFPQVTRVSSSGYSKLRPQHGIQHEINTGGAQPSRSRARPLFGKKRAAALREFRAMEKAGIVTRSEGSPWAAPLHMVQKPGSDSWRPCGDFRNLNNRTVTDSYIVPNLHSLNFQLKDKRVFSRLDLVKGYFQVPVAEASRAKTAVVTPFGTFQFNFMPFGLKNAGATFQRLMDSIFGDLDYVFIYLDDILISSGTEAEHEKHLREVFRRLSKAGLAINKAKSDFFREELEFLGHVISSQGIRPSPKHTAAVRDYPPPKSKEDVSKFLGLLNFFRSFLPKAAGVLLPLTGMMKKTAVFTWGQEQQEAFQKAKEALLNAVTLQHPSPTAQVEVNTDASATHVGAVLLQREDKKQPWQPVAFYSKGLNTAQRKYSTYDREFLGAVLAIKKFKPFLEGREFVLRTDHKSLIPSLLREKTSESDRQQRQLSYLAEMTNNFSYISGPLNTVADALSRPPAEDKGEDEVCAITQEENPRLWCEEELLKAQEADKETLAAADRLVNRGEFAYPTQRGGVKKLLRLPSASNVAARAVLLLPPAYRQAAIKALHEHTHAGQQQTIKMARDRYLWLGLAKDVKKFVKSCTVCQKVKVNRHEHVQPGGFPAEKTRFKTVHVDLVGPLPETEEGYKFILTCIDRATRYPVAIPLKSTETAEVWQQFQDNWIATFGVPALLITDRGSQFTSTYWAEQCQVFGIKSNTTPAYHPEANGLVERWHRTLKYSLSCDRYEDKDWAKRLPMILLGLRARPHLDSELSPHQQAFGCEINLPADFASKEAEELDGVNFYEQLKHARDGYEYPTAVHHTRDDGEASEALQNAAFVLVRQDGHKPPLTAAYRGPFKVKARRRHSYLLEGSDAAEDWVAVNRLKPFHPRPEEGEVGLQQLPRRGRPARVVEAATTGPSTPTTGSSPSTPSTPAYSPPADEFPPLQAEQQTPSRRRERACKVPKGHWRKFCV